ncbi:MAG: N-acetyltransferase [Pseudomonadales bacterium]|nr:N-acetyltransferase [Pseudomonadales bacterium]MBO6564731.1 N-acetyltransferase [Pseudomonadales bacterium]MBO6597720.1 N-acetyltransferase [Pseudomonadales bacterium]MBO6657910.1 N-acetyltransferase [Pseudomonadales bacterium]MBO6704035.1 N-acetyltransferase [Pseudomonadales bacterium]
MTTNLSIREATQDDATALADIYNHYVRETHITFDLEPVTVENREVMIEGYNKNARHRLFVGTDNEQVVGYVSSSQFRTKPAYDLSVETTIYLDQGMTGRGYGKKLYEHLFRELEATDVHRYYGIIALPNQASIELHREFGFVEKGILTEVGYKFDKYWDTLWMEKSESDETIDD